MYVCAYKCIHTEIDSDKGMANLVNAYGSRPKGSCIQV